MVVKYRLDPAEPYSIKKQTGITMVLVLFLLLTCGPQPWWFIGLLGGILVLEVTAWGIFRHWAMQAFWRTVEELKCGNYKLPQELAETTVVMLWERRGIRLLKEENVDSR